MSKRSVSVTRTVHATPAEVFDVLANPAMHPVIDGSCTVTAARGDAPDRLVLGAKFGMNMRFGVRYRISNTVVEFEPDRRIAWAHIGRHRWRYELEPVPGGTEVTETFDWSTSIAPKLIELVGYPNKHVANMEKTLERLAAKVERRAT